MTRIIIGMAIAICIIPAIILTFVDFVLARNEKRKGHGKSK